MEDAHAGEDLPDLAPLSLRRLGDRQVRAVDGVMVDDDVPAAGPEGFEDGGVDLRRRQHQTGKRQVVIVARETKGRTLTTVAKSEAEGVAFARANIMPGTVVHADEASHWDKLAANFPIKRIHHKEAYPKDGANTNAAESFFSRLRRAEIGTHHHVAGRYLAAYATEMAWREDARRQSNGNQFTMIVSAAAMAPKSSAWCGYWQR